MPSTTCAHEYTTQIPAVAPVHTEHSILASTSFLRGSTSLDLSTSLYHAPLEFREIRRHILLGIYHLSILDSLVQAQS